MSDAVKAYIIKAAKRIKIAIQPDDEDKDNTDIQIAHSALALMFGNLDWAKAVPLAPVATEPEAKRNFDRLEFIPANQIRDRLGHFRRICVILNQRGAVLKLGSLLGQDEIDVRWACTTPDPASLVLFTFFNDCSSARMPILGRALEQACPDAAEELLAAYPVRDFQHLAGMKASIPQ